MNTGNGGPTRQDSYFLSPFMLKTREMAYPAPTKGRSKLSPNAAMLFAPFGCTHPPPPAPPFLLAQSLSLKDIAGCDIMKLKVSRCRYATLDLKGLSYMCQDNRCLIPRQQVALNALGSTNPRSTAYKAKYSSTSGRQLGQSCSYTAAGNMHTRQEVFPGEVCQPSLRSYWHGKSPRG